MCVGVCMTEVSDSILPCSLDKSQCSRHLEVNLTQASRHPAEEHLHLHQSKVSNFIVPSQLLLIQNLTWCILEDIVENLFLWEFLYWEYSLWISIENPLKSLNHCLRVWPTSNQGWLWISSLSAMENALEMWVKCRHLMLMLMPWKCDWNVDTLCFAPGGDGWQGWRWLWLGRRAGAPQGLQITSCWKLWNMAFKVLNLQCFRAECILASWTQTTRICTSHGGGRRSLWRSTKYLYRCIYKSVLLISKYYQSSSKNWEVSVSICPCLPQKPQCIRLKRMS